MANETQCVCGLTWSLDFEKIQSQTIADIHAREHAKWEQAKFQNRKRFVNFMFGLPADTEWVKNESS